MDLYQYLKSANTSLFRFEALQDYKVEGDGMDDKEMKEWWNFIESKVKSGVVMQRVRLIIEPLTEYTKNELVVHKKSKTFGDDIRIIKNGIFVTLNIKEEDFWIIDGKIVLRMNYSVDGAYLGFDVIDNNPKHYVDIAKLLLKYSVDL
jgi:hypothetical protein